MQQQVTKPDFSGQDIFVAMDIGNKSWMVSIMVGEIEHRTFSQPPIVEKLVHYLYHNFPGGRYRCVYEAGYQGFWIHDQLRHRGIDCIVVNPADVPTKHKEHTHKTNGVDARKLARSMRSGELDAIYVPSHSALEDRSLVRVRGRFVKKQTRCKNQIKALLTFYGIVAPDEVGRDHWSRRYILWLEEQIAFSRSSGDMALRSLLEELLFLRQTIARVTKEIRSLAETEPYRLDVSYLRTIGGIGVVSAMIFLTELIDIGRFHSLDHLAHYCGLVPREHSTGEEQNISGLPPRRNPMLRVLLVGGAWVAVRKDPALLLAFTKLSARMPKNKAIIRIARKLLNRIRFVLKNQQPYETGIVSMAGTA